MYLIHVHAIPLETSNHYGKCKGAEIDLYIDYKDIDGAFELARYYIEDEGWKIMEIDQEYYRLESKGDLEEKDQRYYLEAIEYGHSIIYNCYLEDDVDEE